MGRTNVDAKAVNPGRVEITITLDADDAQDFAVGFEGPKISGTEHEEEILDAVEEAYEWELAHAKSSTLAEAERRAEKHFEREHSPSFYRER